MTEVEIPYQPLSRSCFSFYDDIVASIFVRNRKKRREVRIPDLTRTPLTEWDLPPDLDLFFRRIYRYWYGQGFYSNLLHEIMNLSALLFMILFSALLLFVLNWNFLYSDCTNEGSCTTEKLFHSNPYQVHRLTFWTCLKLLYLMLFLTFWIGTFLVRLYEIKHLWDIKEFCRITLGITEDQVKYLSWPDLVHRLVLVQQTTKLCIKRDLKENDIINRILRKENYFIGMINKGVFILTVPFPGYRRRHLLTKTMEWSLYWGLISPMFNAKFEIKEHYKTNVEFLKKRFQYLAIGNLVLAPFLLFFLLLYFVMMNAEKMYNSPGSLLERAWSLSAYWKLREFNEMEHQIESRQRLSQKPAQEYLSQFPNSSLIHLGRLLSFIFGSFIALSLCIALLNDSLLEGGGDILGHNLIWWTAILMTGLRLSRGLIPQGPILDPEECLQETVKYTRYYPKSWRGQAHSKEVQENFAKLFCFRAALFFDELASLVLGPYILYYLISANAEVVAQFLQNYTLRVEGVGDICSLAAFDFEKHGNENYGSPFHAMKLQRSHQGKMEKSFLTFMQTYPAWVPDHKGQKLIQNLESYLTSSLHESLYRDDLAGCSSTPNQDRLQCTNCRRSCRSEEFLRGYHFALESFYVSRSLHQPYDVDSHLSRTRFNG